MSMSAKDKIKEELDKTVPKLNKQEKSWVWAAIKALFKDDKDTNK